MAGEEPGLPVSLGLSLGPDWLPASTSASWLDNLWPENILSPRAQQLLEVLSGIGRPSLSYSGGSGSCSRETQILRLKDRNGRRETTSREEVWTWQFRSLLEQKGNQTCLGRRILRFWEAISGFCFARCWAIPGEYARPIADQVWWPALLP